MRDLEGPRSVPAALHAPVPTTSDGSIDWSRAEALIVAVDALLAAGLVTHARPLASELRTMIVAARGPRAEVVALNALAKRES